jgi:ABC-type branched-subunit amino acid transport system substrate-binding protein
MFVAFVAASSLVLASCSSGSDSGSAGGTGAASGTNAGTPTSKAPIPIGYLASTTGFCSDFSQEEVSGARLAVDALNAQGGVLGRPLQLIVRDDQATPDTGVQQARDLVLSKGVKFLAGTCSSAVGLAVRKSVADPSKVLYVAPVADPAVFADAKDSYVFGSLPTTAAEGATVAAYIKSQPNIKRVAFIGEDYSYSQSVFSNFEKALDGSGVSIISKDFATVSDYTPYINKLLSEKPDFVYNNLIVGDLITFTQQAAPLGLFDKLKGNYIGFYDLGSLLALGKKVPVGVHGYTYYPEPYLYNTPEIATLADQYKASTGSIATGAVGDGYNQIWMIAQGIAKAGSVDPGKVSAALAGAKINLVQGPTTIRSCDHLPEGPIAIGTIAAADGTTAFPHLADTTITNTATIYPPC